MQFNLISTSQLVLATLLSYSLSGCGGGGDDQAGTAPKQGEVAKCAGETIPDAAICITLNNRDVITYTPAGEIKGIALFLHGAPGSAKKVSGIFNAKGLTDNNQLLSISPQGSNASWGWSSVNDGDSDNTEDTDFIVDLLAKVRAENNIASDKLYVFGYSAGGFMGYKLACQIPEQITALVSLAGQFRGDFSHCTTSTPIKLHHFHSPKDAEVPMNGRSTGNIQSVAETLEHWRLINGCSEASTTTIHPGVISGSVSTETKTWEGCLASMSFSKMAEVPHEANYKAEVLQEIYAPIFNGL